MKTLANIHLRPAGWVALLVGLTHFVVALLEAQCFFGGSKYRMFWVEIFPAILWFPVSQFIDPNDFGCSIRLFPLREAWLALLALSAVSAGWGLYAYCIVRMIVSPDNWNRKLIVTVGGYALLIGMLLFSPISAFFALLAALVGAAGALCAVIAAVSIRRSAWPAMLFIAANMATGSYFCFWIFVCLSF